MIYPMRGYFRPDDHPLTDGVHVMTINFVHGKGTRTRPGTAYQKLTAILDESTSSSDDSISSADLEVLKISSLTRSPQFDENLEEMELNCTLVESDSTLEESGRKRRMKRSRLSSPIPSSSDSRKDQKPPVKILKVSDACRNRPEGTSLFALLTNCSPTMSLKNLQKFESAPLLPTCSTVSSVDSDFDMNCTPSVIEYCNSSENRSQMENSGRIRSSQTEVNGKSSPNESKYSTTSDESRDSSGSRGSSLHAVSINLWRKGNLHNFKMPFPTQSQLKRKNCLPTRGNLLSVLTNSSLNHEWLPRLHKLEKSSRSFVRKMYTFLVDSLTGVENVSVKERYLIAIKLKSVQNFALHEIAFLSMRINIPISNIKNEFFSILKNQILLMYFEVLRQIRESLTKQIQEFEDEDNEHMLCQVNVFYTNKTALLEGLIVSEISEEFVKIRVTQILSALTNPPGSEQEMVYELENFESIDEMRDLLTTSFINCMEDFPSPDLVHKEFARIFPV